VPKHLVEIEGEVLLERTVRQFNQYSEDVIVVGPDQRYELGVPVYTPTAQFGNEMDKFASSFDMWSDGRNILVYGDVYFTDEAVAAIMADTSDWKYF
jgi:choline kinase